MNPCSLVTGFSRSYSVRKYNLASLYLLDPLNTLVQLSVSLRFLELKKSVSKMKKTKNKKIVKNAKKSRKFKFCVIGNFI